MSDFEIAYSELTKSHYFILNGNKYDITEFVNKIRADAIDEYCADMLSKIEFEEKWLMKAKSDNSDTNLAFMALKTFCKTRAEQLKENN